jgi:hypothetical protein
MACNHMNIGVHSLEQHIYKFPSDNINCVTPSGYLS